MWGVGMLLKVRYGMFSCSPFQLVSQVTADLDGAKLNLLFVNLNIKMRK